MGGGGNLPIGPGIWGFIAFFVLAIALWLLVRNMNSRLRRMAYRDRDAAAEAQRDAAADADRLGRDHDSSPTSDDDDEGDDEGDDRGPAPRTG